MATPLREFLSSCRFRSAWAAALEQPVMLDRPGPNSTVVCSTLPAADARIQWRQMNRVRVFCLSVTETPAGTRVVYAVPAGVRLG